MQETADLVTFTEEILNRKLSFYAVKGNRYMTLKSSDSSFFYYGKFYKEKLKQQIPKLNLKD